LSLEFIIASCDYLLRTYLKNDSLAPLRSILKIVESGTVLKNFKGSPSVFAKVVYKRTLGGDSLSLLL